MNETDATTRNRENGRAGDRLPGEGQGEWSPTELQYRLLVESVRDYGIFLMDADGIITHWGEGAERVKGFTAEETVGHHLSMLYPPGGGEDGTAEEHLRIAATEGEYMGEGHRLHRHRGLFPARVVLTALRRDGVLHGFSKVTQDLTARKRHEAELQEAVRAAETASVEKSRFLATMSHEIRTPLNAILGYADLLDVGVAGVLSPGQRAYLDRVRASGRHLLALLEDVLDFARVEAGRLEVERREARLEGPAGAALELVRPQAEARRLVVASDCPPEAAFWGDERRVRQILANLLSNAVKFTARGGSITLACGRAEHAPAEAQVHGDGPWTWVRVEDTGIGIDPERLSSVFEPFVQIDAGLTRTHEGTGLGLAISRRLARLMDGDLTVRSHPGEGSAFTLWLPATAPAAPSDPGAAAPADEAPLTRVARVLAGAASEVSRAVSERLRADPATPLARECTEAELEDHIPTLLADVAQALVILENDGDDAGSIAQDGVDVQELLARRHGQQRARLGWSAAGLLREYEILRAEVEFVLRDACASPRELDEALAVVNRLLGRAEDLSLRALRPDG